MDSLPQTELRRLHNGITLEVASSGPADGPLVILLHGFPDSWRTWRNQIPHLVATGFRVLAPNMRGYGGSDQPSGVSSYDLDRLIDDVLALADSEGAPRFQLVGHDWGGIVAFWTAACFPERVTRLSVLNAPHPGAFRKYVLKHPSQLLKSWYVGFFQLPAIPEALLRRGAYQGLLRAVKSAGPGRVDEDEEAAHLVSTWSKAGSLSGMIHYYRAFTRRTDRSLQVRIRIPVLILFSQQDPALERGLAIASQNLCDDCQIIWFEQTKHWIHWEEPTAVSEALVSFLEEPLTNTTPTRTNFETNSSFPPYDRQ